MAGVHIHPQNAEAVRQDLLTWFARHKRDLPWRLTRDPYLIWVSEVMLQQTRVAVVIESFLAFTARFPSVRALARAHEQEVLGLWSGLGYYRRARMLHQAAQMVVEQRNGTMPSTSAELRALPGVGSYTSAAIASIAFGESVAVVDGNVERVLCRLAGWDASAGTAGPLRKKIDDLADELLDRNEPGDFNQAMMELGATVCKPQKPLCSSCPLFSACATRGEHRTAPRAPMTVEDAACALCLRVARIGRSGITEVLLEQRSASESVMPGMWELPALLDTEIPEKDARLTVRHAIMQVNYRIRVREVDMSDVDRVTVIGGERRWFTLKVASSMALTGLTRKILRRVHLLDIEAPVLH